MMARLISLAALGWLAGCASVERPATLGQAEALYQALQEAGAGQRVEAELLKTRIAIDSAQRAVNEKYDQAYVNSLAHIALRQAQIAEAEHMRALAAAAADSLRTARLNRLLTLSEQQRAALAQQQQLSQQEIEQLRSRTDSLRQAVEISEAQRAELEERLNQALVQLRTLVTEITNIRETQRGLVITLGDILFDVDKATLKPGAEQNIRRIAAILNQYPDYRISVEGHTDATGSDAYNRQLSERRAQAVREALLGGGVEAGRIESRGFGESQPIATNETPAGRQQNRRVEVIVLGAGRVADALRDSTNAAPGTPPPPR